MKVKIIKNKKKIDERYTYSPTSGQPVDRIFLNLLSSAWEEADGNIKTIFSKSLVFYDLETTGFARSGGKDDDQIHQIAALVYDTKGDPTKLTPTSPDNQFISKIQISQDIIDRKAKVSSRRAHHLDGTPDGEYQYFKNQIKRTGKSSPRFKASMPKTSGGNALSIEFDSAFTKDLKGHSNYVVRALFYHLYIHNKPPHWKHKQPTAGVKDTVTKNVTVYELVVEYINSSSSGFERTDKKRLLATLDSKNPKPEELQFLFEAIFSQASGELIEYHKKGKPNVATALRKRLQKYDRWIDSTIEENKQFTNYDEFPKPPYDKKMYKGGIVKEGDGLKGFMGFFNQMGQSTGAPQGQKQISPSMELEDGTKINGIETLPAIPNDSNYILVGQNIINFDNPFVAARCDKYNIDYEVFYNSYVYDTRRLFEYFVNYMKLFNQMVNFFTKSKYGQKSAKTWKTEDEQLYNLLRSMSRGEGNPNAEIADILNDLKFGGKPKAKLAKLMTTFLKDPVTGMAPIQTHTADDDCEKIAEVMIEVMKKFADL